MEKQLSVKTQTPLIIPDDETSGLLKKAAEILNKNTP